MDKLTAQEYLTQGVVLAGMGKNVEALAYFDKAEKDNPTNIDVYFSKGIALANLDRLNEAKTQFEKALVINRSAGRAYYHLASIAVLQGNTSLGLENYNKAIAYGYDDAQLHYSIGLLHEEQGVVDRAIRSYSNAILKDALRPDIRVRKTRLLIQTNRLAEALQELDDTIMTNPDVFEVYHLKFSILVQMRQFTKADELLNHAMELFPKDTSFTIDKVQLYTQQNKIDAAIALLNSLKNAADIDDSMRRKICLEKAHIFAIKNDIKSAIISLEQAKSLSDIKDVFDAEVTFLLANCYLSVGEYEKTLALSRELIQRADEDYYKQTALYFEPLALKMLGHIDEARLLYMKAIDEYRRMSLEFPGNLDTYLLRTMCLRDTEQYDKALEILDYVVTLQPDRAEPRLLKVNILEASGRKNEAAEETKAVNALLPENLRAE